MGKESVWLGIVCTVLGIIIWTKSSSFGIAFIPLALGIALIIFNKEEDKIEKRRDVK